MADPTLVVTVGGIDFPLSNPTVQEVREVKRWTGFASRPEWFSAVIREDADALLAAYVIAKRHAGEHVDYNDSTDFPVGTEARFVDGAGREVELILELKDDGTVRLGPDGNAIPVLDGEGKQQWRDVSSGVVVPFERTATTSTTPQVPTSSGVTGTGTQTTAVS